MARPWRAGSARAGLDDQKLRRGGGARRGHARCGGAALVRRRRVGAQRAPHPRHAQGRLGDSRRGAAGILEHLRREDRRIVGQAAPRRGASRVRFRRTHGNRVAGGGERRASRSRAHAEHRGGYDFVRPGNVGDGTADRDGHGGHRERRRVAQAVRRVPRGGTGCEGAAAARPRGGAAGPAARERARSRIDARGGGREGDGNEGAGRRLPRRGQDGYRAEGRPGARRLRREASGELSRLLARRRSTARHPRRGGRAGGRRLRRLGRRPRLERDRRRGAATDRRCAPERARGSRARIGSAPR